MELIIALLGGVYYFCRYTKHISAENSFNRKQTTRINRGDELEMKYGVSSEEWNRLVNYRLSKPKEFFEFIAEDCEYIFGEDWESKTNPNSIADQRNWFTQLYLAKHGKIYMGFFSQGFVTGFSSDRDVCMRFARRMENLLNKAGADIELAIDYIALKSEPFSQERLYQCLIKDVGLCVGTPYRISDIMPLLPMTSAPQVNTSNKRDKIDRYIRLKSESFLKSVTLDERKDFIRKMRNTKNIDALCEQLRKYADSRIIIYFADNFEEYITHPGGFDEQELYGEMLSLSYALSGVTDRCNLIYRIIHADAKNYSDPNFWLASNKLERAIIEIIRSVRSDGWLLTVSKKVWEEEAEKAIYSNK